MSGPGTVNTAGPHSFVGVQAGEVWNSDIYVVGPDDPPEREYELGVKYLECGVPDKARDHIERALNRGYDSSRVRFHLVLALLSKRSYRDLDRRNLETLKALSGRLIPDTEGAGEEAWHEALRVVLMLVACVDGSDADPDTVVDRLQALPNPQRDLALRHLGLVLTGSMKQAIWKKYQETAQRDRKSNDRTERAWIYFQPEPAPARARRPRPPSTSGWDVFGATLLAGGVLFLFFSLLRSALGHGSMAALLACLVTLVLLPAAGWHIALWDHKRRRVIAALKDQSPRTSQRTLPDNGFTERVESTFEHYFGKYTPVSEKRADWLEATKGIRRAQSREVARIYRETGVRPGQVNWLIRFLVRDVQQRRNAGLPLRPEEIHRVAKATRIRCQALCALSALGIGFVVVAAFQHAPVVTVGCVSALVFLSRFAIPLWLGNYSERRRFREETREHMDILAVRKAEYERWKDFLDRNRPTETEMEKWLEADKTLILHEAMSYHRLAWHEVITHAFLPTPDRPCKNAKMKGGPLRYSKYVIRIFLITNEGVREASAELDFERASWLLSERDNYRFDALSSVQVEMSSRYNYTLNITLTNGPTKSTIVSETPTLVGTDITRPKEEDQNETTKINLEAAGFPHTLRVLEGIAAEGKPWFDRQ
ncbi:hypothetical protein VSQ78_04230 [Nocardiopsis alba]|uniref:Uncharacterized protein n=1 Tax=Nocardiopsis alba TaxID=53437 RepID=A0ABV5DQN2_9ACTN